MINPWLYIKSESNLWPVGHYSPSGEWVAESDHSSVDAASYRCFWLNGGRPLKNETISPALFPLDDTVQILPKTLVEALKPTKTMRLNHWMVWAEGRPLPRKIHDERETAVAEAERLARKERRPVHLFQSVAMCKPETPVQPPVAWTELNNRL